MIRPVLMCVAILAGSAGAQTEIGVRGGEPGSFPVRTSDVSGVTITRDGVEITLPWSAVRTVSGESTEFERGFAAAGEALWRGISRLDRGDPIAAIEPLETAFAEFGGHNGITTGEAADALLDARLRLGSASEAVVPWLVRLEQDARLPSAPTGRRVDIDPRVLLVPDLPPVFVGSRRSPRIAAELAGEDFERWSAGPNRRLAELYASALLIAAGENPPRIPDDLDIEGVRLVWAMVESRQSNAAARSAARRELRGMLRRTDEAWVRAWCHAGIGLSLLLESDRERLAGVGHLLFVASEHAASQPYLAGVCLAESARVLLEAGREDPAIELVSRLEAVSPRHPSLTLPTIRAITSLRAHSSETGS